MAPDDVIRIQHMNDAAESALRFVENKRRADLDADLMLVFALTRAVEIISESASKVSMEGRAELPKVPGTKIAGMRNRLGARLLRCGSRNPLEYSRARPSGIAQSTRATGRISRVIPFFD